MIIGTMLRKVSHHDLQYVTGFYLRLADWI